LKSSIARQGWAYYEGYIYYTNWSWERFGGDGKSFIYVYNLKGKRMEYLLIKQDIGEIEDVAFINGKMLLGFNGNDGKAIFYLEKIPELEEEVEEDDYVIVEDKEENFLDHNLVFMVIIIILLIILFSYLIKNRKKGAEK